MSEYTIENGVASVRNRYDALIVPPIFIITLFCFGFVMLQPHKAASHTAAASNKSPAVVSDTPSSLPPLNLAATADLSKLDTAAPTAQSSASDGTQTLAMPQSPTNSASSLQSAKPNTTTATPSTTNSKSTPLKTVAAPVKKLLH